VIGALSSTLGRHAGPKPVGTLENRPCEAVQNKFRVARDSSEMCGTCRSGSSEICCSSGTDVIILRLITTHQEIVHSNRPGACQLPEWHQGHGTTEHLRLREALIHSF